MLRQITLHGPLAAKLSSETIEFDADDLPTLFSGLKSAYPDFLIELRKHNEFALALKNDDDLKFIKQEDLGWSFGEAKEIHLVTGEHGAGVEVAAMVTGYQTLAAAWAASAYAAAAYVAVTIAVTVAMAYVIGRISMSLADKPAGTNGSAEERGSYLFDGAVNLQGQGHPIPVVYGRFRVGSVVVSAEVTSEKSAIGFNDTVQITYEETASGNIFSNDIDGNTLTLTSYVVNGTTKTPGSTYTGTGYSITIASNGNYTITPSGSIVTNFTATYYATATNGLEITANLQCYINQPYVNYNESTGGDGSGGTSGGY